MRRTATVATSALLLVLLMAPAGAMASAPTITTNSWDETQVLVGDYCGLTLEAHLVGRAVLRSWSDAAGNYHLETYTAKVTYTNMATGASVTVDASGSFVQKYYSDGSYWEENRGNILWGYDPRDPYNPPGWLFLQSGLWRYSYDSSGTTTEYTLQGRIVALCPLLGA